MEYYQGDIVIVPFPFTNLKTAKVRPAVVVSNEHINKKTEDVILAAMTTTIRNDEFSFELHNSFLSYPLRKSEVRCNKLFTCEKRIIHKVISKMNDDSLSQLILMVKDNFQKE